MIDLLTHLLTNLFIHSFTLSHSFIHLTKHLKVYPILGRCVVTRHELPVYNLHNLKKTYEKEDKYGTLLCPVNGCF